MGVQANLVTMDGLVYEKVDEDEIDANDDEDSSDDKTLDDIIDAYSQQKQN